MLDEKVFPAEAATDDDDDDLGSTLSYQEPSSEGHHLDPRAHDFENPDSIEMKLSRKKALLEFRCRVEDAILSKYILGKNRGKSNPEENLKDIALWGVPLLPSKAHHGTDAVLMKFLKARDFKVSEAFNMLRRTLKWRREFNVEGIREENLGFDLENVVHINGEDRQGRPVCYDVSGALKKERERCEKILEREEKREEFLRWRIQIMEEGIQKIRFGSGGAESVIQVIDLKHTHSHAMKELRSVNRRIMLLFQENYPELIYRTIYINVPFWYFVSHSLQSQRTKNNFIFARPARLTQTLLKFIAPENMPAQYGGLKRENDDEFSPDDKVIGLIVRGSGTQIIQIPAAEEGVTVMWDMIVIGHEVSYKEEFIPDDDCSYNVLIQNEKKMRESVRNSFYIYEPGKIVITICNATPKRKKIFYRHKSKPTLPLYILK